MRCQREGGLSATTKVKVFSPEIHHITLGQGCRFLEASIAACVRGEYVSDVPGSESVAGKLTGHNGTCQNHITADVSVHHCIGSLHRGIAALHHGVVSLQCGIVRLHYGIAGLYRGVVNGQKGLQTVGFKAFRRMNKKIRKLLIQKPAVCLCRFIPALSRYNHW